MAKHKPCIVDVNSLKDAEELIKNIGSDEKSINIMAPKMITKVIKLEKVVLQDSIIIKQDMLSIGGEVAVPKDTFKLHEEKGDILVIGTLNQLSALVNKLRRHYGRLKIIADEIENVLENEK